MSHNDRKPIRVLAIEDDEDDYLLTSETLDDITSAEYVITWVQSANQGLTALRGNEYDVCLLDYRLGADTGIDVLQSLTDEGIFTPCILLTGQDSSQTDLEAMQAGAADYLVKGAFSEDDLERSIRYAIGRATALRSLRESQARFRSLFENANDGIVLVDDTGHLVAANEASCEMFGVERHALIGAGINTLLGDRDSEAVLQRFANPSFDQFERSGMVDASAKRRDGGTFPVQLSISVLIEDGRRYWTAVIRDVSEHTELLHQLRHNALHDRVTGLANRTLLVERVEQAARSHTPGGNCVAVLVINIDNFKRINDSVGHQLGDLVLGVVAKRLEESTTDQRTVARLRGDEFAILLEDIADIQPALRLADHVRSLLSQRIRIHDHCINTTCSIGVAFLDSDEVNADDLIRNADVAMYAAKARGKDCVEIFENSMYRDMVEEIQMEEALTEAVAQGRIEAAFQPIVDLRTGLPVAVEALARWADPEHGQIPPDTFIPLAEKSGLIRDLGYLILEKSVEQAVAWQEEFGPRIVMSVNVASGQLSDNRFVPYVSELLKRSGLFHGGLCLEITESVMLGDVDTVIGRLEELRELGVAIALDDFGTGYSSLSYLQRLPVDVLKLDRSFVVESETDRGRTLISTVVDVSRSFNMTSVAEGVETESQRRLMIEVGFERAQGYLFSRPLGADEITQCLREHFDGGGYCADDTRDAGMLAHHVAHPV